MLLSVVVPVYNSEKTIERCMRSIMGQTYRNLEIIVVIDGGKSNLIIYVKILQMLTKE